VEFLNLVLIFTAAFLVLRKPERERLAFRLLVVTVVPVGTAVFWLGFARGDSPCVLSMGALLLMVRDEHLSVGPRTLRGIERFAFGAFLDEGARIAVGENKSYVVLRPNDKANAD